MPHPRDRRSYEHCIFAAGEIRALSGSQRDQVERADLLTVADIVERRGSTVLIQRIDHETIRSFLLDFVVAIEILFGAPESNSAEPQQYFDMFEVTSREEGWVVTLIRPDGRRSQVRECANKAEAEDWARELALDEPGSKVRTLLPQATTRRRSNKARHRNGLPRHSI